MSNKIGRK
ncbi:hypothetical protein Tco_0353924, partial [Tanacetum coccineum]